MRHGRQCLRFKSAGISTREIARRVGVASSTVRAAIACPLDAGLTDAVLEQLLFANAGVKPGHRRHAEPDWAVPLSLSRAPAGRRRSPIGSTPMGMPSRRSATFRICACRTIPRALSSKPASTIRRSIEPMPRGPRITAPPFCQPGQGGHRTRRKSSRRCSLSSGGYCGGCAQNFLQLGRDQRGDRRTDAASQRRAPDPAARRDAPALARRDRSSGSEEPAGRTLWVSEWRACRVGYR
jgi:hypothetical protein